MFPYWTFSEQQYKKYWQQLHRVNIASRALTTTEEYWSALLLLPAHTGCASSGSCNAFLHSLNKFMKKDSTLYPIRERKCICTPQHCATNTFSFYSQADTGIWRKHVDIVFTKRINNNCFAPVNKMCCKLENLYWENREKLGEQNQYTNCQQEFHTTTTRVLFELKWKKNVPSFHPAFRINSWFNITCGRSKSIWQGYEFPEIHFTFLSNLVFPASKEFLQTVSIQV